MKKSVTHPPKETIDTLRKIDRQGDVDRALSDLYTAYYAQTKDPGIYIFEIMRRLDDLMTAYNLYLD